MSELTRERSEEAYRVIRDSGYVSKRCFEVYDIHYRFGALGKRAMFEMFRRENLGTVVQVDSFGPRYAQLVRGGLMRETGEVVCAYTKMRVTTWDCTTKIPTSKLPPLPKTTSRKQLVSTIAELELVIREKDEEIRSLKTKGQMRLF